MLVFERRVRDLEFYSKSADKYFYIRAIHVWWNRVTTGLFDHKITAKSNIVEFDAILSIVSVAADAE